MSDSGATNRTPRILCRHCAYHVDGTLLLPCRDCQKRIAYEQEELFHAHELIRILREERRLCPECIYNDAIFYHRRDEALPPSLRQHSVRAWFHHVLCEYHSRVREVRDFASSTVSIKNRIDDENTILSLRGGSATTERDSESGLVDTEREEERDKLEGEVDNTYNLAEQTGQIGAGPDSDFKTSEYWKRVTENIPEQLRGSSFWSTRGVQRYFERSYCRWPVGAFGEICGTWIPFVKGKRRSKYCAEHAAENKRLNDARRQSESRSLKRKDKKRESGVIYVAAR